MAKCFVNLRAHILCIVLKIVIRFVQMCDKSTRLDHHA